jgi:hypothetical protein
LDEPLSNVNFHGVERSRLYDLLKKQMVELGRSPATKALADNLLSLADSLVRIKTDEMNRLESTIDSILSHATVVPLSSRVFGEARRLATRFGLPLQDSIIVATVLEVLGGSTTEERSCFVSENFRDFADPELLQELDRCGCKYISNFRSALSFVQSIVGQE